MLPRLGVDMGRLDLDGRVAAVAAYDDKQTRRKIERYHQIRHNVGELFTQTSESHMMLEKKLQILNEVITGSKRPDVAKLLARLKREGRVVRLAPRIYTTNLTDTAENIVRRNLWTIVGRLWPGSRLCHRTALEYAPHDGHVFLAYKYTRKVILPGITIHFLSTPGTLASDYPFIEGLGVSSRARALLENLEPDRTQGGVDKCLGVEAVEELLDAEFSAGGEAALNKLRDEARAISDAVGHAFEFARLDRMIGALLSTRPADVLKSQVAIARAAGEPFDSSRIELFGTLLERLGRMEFPDYPDVNVSDSAFATFAFFESYFSNYIEGTEFELEEARHIVETGIAIPTRDADSHDVLGTYAVASNRREMSRCAASPDEFLELLRERHRLILAGRPSSAPGMFMMNAELTTAGQAKVLVPTVFRPDYIGALRRLSRNGDPSVLIAAMTRLRDFSRRLSGEDFPTMRRQLEDANAFRDDENFILRF